jgi:hypothetical protein
LECRVYEDEVKLPDGRVVKATVVEAEIGKTLARECIEKLGGG